MNDCRMYVAMSLLYYYWDKKELIVWDGPFRVSEGVRARLVRVRKPRTRT